ncbi:type III secretion protein [Yersinia rochesterensis]|uniref:type III secretion protein n=1 Tax=Yersinia rochesterensis TaxID=1604335 RepID=UPI00119E12FC|nr:type III secretion protein [Yersinia rochesterensis]MDN0108851.1 type III secretion protein [Yersinia rochesterensis]MDR5019624.1 type III secretion protein [Yersinia rochesterensis]
MRLLALRQHQERRLRRQLISLQQEEQQQEQQLAHFHQTRQGLCQQLQVLAQWRGTLNPTEARDQRALQHQTYQAERRLQKSLAELAARRLQQQAAITAQLALLRTNQREQEKLRMLIKDESNRC